MNPLVSVIIPNYNHERFLKKRIDSVLNQTYQDFEIIILDDHSTDNSQEIIELYKNHKSVKQIIYNDTNSGSTFKQWKKGIELAQGDYVWIAESDDIAKPDLLDHLVEIISHDNVVVAYSKSTSDLKEFDTVENNAVDIKFHPGEEFIRSYMLTSPQIVNASAVLFKKSVVNNFLLSEVIKYKYAGDWLFWSYLCKNGIVAESSKIANFFRRHQNSVAHQADKSGLFITEGLQVVKFIKDKLKIAMPWHVIKVWASVWAQNHLLRKQKSKADIYTALSISPLLLLCFSFYYIKFKWFTKLNILFW